MATANYDTIGAAIAARFAAGVVTPPANASNVRTSSANPPGAIGPTPAVVVTLNETDQASTSANGLKVDVLAWYVRFYLDQTSDLERTEPLLRKWLYILKDQLKASVQLAGLVDLAMIVSWKVGILTYGGLDYTGLELVVHTATSEGWAATA